MWRLYCRSCGFEGGPEEYYPKCPSCGSPLEVRGALPRFRRLLGEGLTPLVEVPEGEGRGFLAKLEYLNPTGSFKDRGVSASLQLAQRLGYKCVVVDSSGNTALSVAAYSAFLGLEARVHAPRSISPGKRSLIEALGARLAIAESREEASAMAERESSECYHVGHLTSPIFLEGVKSLGEEMEGYREGSSVYVPASSGTLLLGIHRAGGFRMVAVQTPENASLLGKARLLASLGGPRGRLADALVVKRPPRLDDMAGALRAGGGLVIVGDEAIRDSLRALYSMGIIVEPSSATVYAA